VTAAAGARGTPKAEGSREAATFFFSPSGRVPLAKVWRLCRDRHNRHTYISRLVAGGANIKVAQELACHSTPALTLGRYAHVQLVDQRRALDALPSIDAPRADVAALAATGT
jgi:hypothetical protein